MKMRSRILTAALTVALLVLSSCANYVVRDAKTATLNPGSGVAVVVKGAEDNKALSGFMLSALMNAGFNAKAVEASELIPNSMRKDISPDYKYSFLESLVISMYSGQSQVKGNEEFLEKLLKVNDIQESKIRLEDLIELIDDFKQKWELDYLITIEKSSQYSYSVRVTELATKTLIYVYYIDANQNGFDEQIAEPEGLKVSKSALGGDKYSELRFCEHIVKELVK